MKKASSPEKRLPKLMYCSQCLACKDSLLPQHRPPVAQREQRQPQGRAGCSPRLSIAGRLQGAQHAAPAAKGDDCAVCGGQGGTRGGQHQQGQAAVGQGIVQQGQGGGAAAQQVRQVVQVDWEKGRGGRGQRRGRLQRLQAPWMPCCDTGCA